MRDLRIDSCPLYISGLEFPYGLRDRKAPNLLLHNTEFESSTEQIFKIKMRILNESHVFKRVRDGVVRFIEERWEGHGHGPAIVY